MLPRPTSRTSWVYCIGAVFLVLVLLSVGGVSCSSTSGEPRNDERSPSVSSASAELRNDEDRHSDAERCLDIEVPQSAASREVIRVASIDRTIPQRAFQQHAQRFRCCYEGLLDRAPSEPLPSGPIVLTMTITEGLVEQSNIMRETRPESLEYDDEFARCIIAVADAMTFPEWISQAPGAESIRINYPLTFNSP